MSTGLEFKSPTVGGQGSSRNVKAAKLRGEDGARYVPAAARNTDWMDRAACRGKVASPEDDWWFADEAHGTSDLAVSFCQQRCEVRFECLTYALAREHLDGVWGGMKASERRSMQKQPGCRIPIVEQVGRDDSLQPHGTNAARLRHRRAGEPYCGRCEAVVKWGARVAS